MLTRLGALDAGGLPARRRIAMPNDNFTFSVAGIVAMARKRVVSRREPCAKNRLFYRL